MSAEAVPAGVAANHPATAEAGLRVLESGGTAADAAVAATLACCVAESVVAGLGGGGFTTYYDAGRQQVTCLDFFCSVPGIGADRPAAPMSPIPVTFGHLPQPYAIGGPSVGVPGVAAGLAEVHRRWGRLPWASLGTPAIDLATDGVRMPPALADTLRAVYPALVTGDGAGIYAPGGRLLAGGDLLMHPGLASVLAVLAEEGTDSFYHGKIADLIIDAVQAGGGILTADDLAAYQVRERPVRTARMAGRTVFGRADHNHTIATIASLPKLRGLAPGPRAVAVAQALRGYPHQAHGDTSNLSVIDPAGNACVVTLTLGIGSGVWLPGAGVHLNSMLGEGELATADRRPGTRVASMMCPLVVLDEAGRVRVAAGSAGASRIRSALVHTLVNLLVDDLAMPEAVGRARFHIAGDTAHLEPGRPAGEPEALAGAGFLVHEWPAFDHYFGGVSAVGDAGAAGDPRRGGAGALIRQGVTGSDPMKWNPATSSPPPG